MLDHTVSKEHPTTDHTVSMRHCIPNHTARIRHLISDHTAWIRHPTQEHTTSMRNLIVYRVPMILLSQHSRSFSISNRFISRFESVSKKTVFVSKRNIKLGVICYLRINPQVLRSNQRGHHGPIPMYESDDNIPK